MNSFLLSIVSVYQLNVRRMLAMLAMFKSDNVPGIIMGREYNFIQRVRERSLFTMLGMLQAFSGCDVECIV